MNTARGTFPEEEGVTVSLAHVYAAIFQTSQVPYSNFMPHTDPLFPIIR